MTCLTPALMIQCLVLKLYRNTEKTRSYDRNTV